MLLLIAVAPRIVIIHSMIQIHLMLLLIAAKDYKKLVEEYHSNTSHVTINLSNLTQIISAFGYSNTSHVTINLEMVAGTTEGKINSNTSHVTINPRLQHQLLAREQIQIHLMLLLIDLC